MARREFLQLAKPFKADNPKVKIAGWYASEKLDGSRLFWDGGITRDLTTCSVPYANIRDPKTGQLKKKVKPIATGLWSRYGNPVIAPDWFLDDLPETPLDGEIWAGRGKFQLCRSIVAGDDPDPRWDQVKFMVYGMPSPDSVFRAGEIKNPNFVIDFGPEVLEWFEARIKPGYISLTSDATFEEEWQWMKGVLHGRKYVFRHRQTALPDGEADARDILAQMTSEVVEAGGEGMIIRDPAACWTPKRVPTLLKVKPEHDDEARIVGFTSGRRTLKGSKHLGCIGAIITEYNGKRLELSGLTDKERMFRTQEMQDYAAEHPGKDMPEWFHGISFRVGQTITFKYRELSDAGIPKDGRYFRQREVL